VKTVDDVNRMFIMNEFLNRWSCYKSW